MVHPMRWASAGAAVLCLGAAGSVVGLFVHAPPPEMRLDRGTVLVLPPAAPSAAVLPPGTTITLPAPAPPVEGVIGQWTGPAGQ